MNGGNEYILIKLIAYFPKILAAIVGAVLSLVLSGDIDNEGKIKVSTGVLMKFTFSVCISLYGGEAFIEQFNLQDKSVMYHGAIMLTFAVFGMLVLGIIYQSIAMLKGKPISEIFKEIHEAFTSIFFGDKK